MLKKIEREKKKITINPPTPLPPGGDLAPPSFTWDSGSDIIRSVISTSNLNIFQKKYVVTRDSEHLDFFYEQMENKSDKMKIFERSISKKKRLKFTQIFKDSFKS